MGDYLEDLIELVKSKVGVEKRILNDAIEEIKSNRDQIVEGGKQVKVLDTTIDELRGDLNSVVAKNIELREGINELLECPMWVDQATVPKAGVEANPKQVVIEASISLLKIRKLKDLVGIEE